MAADAWNTGYVRCLGVQLFGGTIDVDERGEWIRGDNILLLFNADHANTIPFVLPKPDEPGEPWELILDTAQEDIDDAVDLVESYPLQPCSVVVMRSKLPNTDDSVL
jgi:hypothetical protein